MKLDDWTELFQGIRQLPPATREELRRRGRMMNVPAGKVIFSPGNAPDNLLFLIEGTVRVSQTSESGREIVLYRVEAGQSCVLTTACILTGEVYSAEGIAETDVTAIALPRSAFDDLIDTVPAFRNFVMSAYSRRIVDLMRVIDDVAFGRIDVRLADRLIALADGEDVLKVTHQQLATELGTAREVISRQLNDFQRRGWIAQSRGKVEILDRARLENLSETG